MDDPLKGITVNGVPLSSVLEDKKPEPEDDYCQQNDKVFKYRKPLLGKISSRERHGKVKKLQKEINFANRTTIINGQMKKDDIMGAIVAVLLTSEKPMTAHDISEDIYKNFRTEMTLKDISHRVRYQLGTLKRSKLANVMLITERKGKTRATYQIREGALSMSPEGAIGMAKIKTKDYNKPGRKPKPIKKPIINQEPPEEQKTPVDVSDGKVINITGPIHIHLHFTFSS